jgi:spore coat protein CotH
VLACGEAPAPAVAGQGGAMSPGTVGTIATGGNLSASSGGHAGVAGQSTVPASGSGVGGSSGGSLVGGASGTGVDTSEEIYDPEKFPRFDLDLPVTSMTALGQDPDTYVRGSLRYGSETIADIGVRIKGEGSKRTLEEKAAFKLKFDEFVPKQSFHGLRRMTLNNMVEDPSFLAERLAFHFFRAQKLPAPRCNSARVFVNGQFFGVYANVEAEDKTFLRRWFESDAGNLYEEGQVDFEPGKEAAFDLETNEEANDRSDLVALIAAVTAAKPASYLTDLGTQLDTTHFLAFTATEAAVNQWDMYGYTVFYPNNFRIYREPLAQKFVMLPWGMDMSMKPFRDTGKPHIKVLELAREGDFENGAVTAGRIFQGCLNSPACRAAYAAVVKTTAMAYEAAGLPALAEKYHTQIAEEVAKDPRKEYSAAEIETGYQSLLKTIRGRPASLRADAAE